MPARERPYTRQTCNRAFSRAGQLKIYLWIRTGEKPYKCQTCDNSFSLAQTLKRHFRVHAGEKPYSIHMPNVR